MLKVLIVEDEVLARTGLRTLVDWEANGFVLCGEAVDGQEALELLEREPADIVITDIRMPVMDGLELIRRIRERGWPCQVVVLSSYDDFDYVRQALVLGARDYIHKPTMTPEDIIAALKRVAAEIGEGGRNRTAPSPRRCLEQCLNAWLQGNREPAGAARALSDVCCVLGVLRMLPPRDAPKQDGFFLELDGAVRRHWDRTLGKGNHMLSACARLGDRWVFAREEPFTQRETEELVRLAQQACPGKALWSATPYPGVFSSLEEVLSVLNGRVDEAYALEEELASLGGHVRQAVLLIREQYADNSISLERIAATIHVNAAYLSRVFQKEAHRTFGEYLTDIRLKEAQRLLRDTRLTVGQVGERVGYGNDKYFMNVFKKRFGMTPGSYRRESRQEDSQG